MKMILLFAAFAVAQGAAVPVPYSFGNFTVNGPGISFTAVGRSGTILSQFGDNIVTAFTGTAQFSAASDGFYFVAGQGGPDLTFNNGTICCPQLGAYLSVSGGANSLSIRLVG
jgi:hypothetical protein